MSAAEYVTPERQALGTSTVRTAHQMLQHAREQVQAQFDAHYPDIIAGKASQEQKEEIEKALINLSFLRTYFAMDMAKNWKDMEKNMGECMGMKQPVPIPRDKTPLLVTLQSLHDDAEEIVMHVESDVFVRDYRLENMPENFAIVMEIARKRVRQQVELWEAQLLQRGGKDPWENVYKDPTWQKLFVVAGCLDDCVKADWAPKRSGAAQQEAPKEKTHGRSWANAVTKGNKKELTEDEQEIRKKAEHMMDAWSHVYHAKDGVIPAYEDKWTKEKREAKEALQRLVEHERAKRQNYYKEVREQEDKKDEWVDEHEMMDEIEQEATTMNQQFHGEAWTLGKGMFAPSTQEADVQLEDTPSAAVGGEGYVDMGNAGQRIAYFAQATYSHAFKKMMGVHQDTQSKETIAFFNRVEQMMPGFFEMHLSTNLGSKFKISVRRYARWKHTLVEPFVLIANQCPFRKRSEDVLRHFVDFSDPKINYGNLQREAPYAIYGRGNEIDGMVHSVLCAHTTKTDWFENYPAFTSALAKILQNNGEETYVTTMLNFARAYYSTHSPAVQNLGSLGETSTFIWNFQGAVFGVRMYTKSIGKLWYTAEDMPPEIQQRVSLRPTPGRTPEDLQSFTRAAPHSSVLITQILQKLQIMESSMKSPWQRVEQDLASKEYLVTPERKIDWMFKMMLKRASEEGAEEPETLFKVKRREGGLQATPELLQWKNGVYYGDLESAPETLVFTVVNPKESDQEVVRSTLQLDTRMARQSGVFLYKGKDEIHKAEVSLYCTSFFERGFRDRKWAWVLDHAELGFFRKELHSRFLTEAQDAGDAVEAPQVFWRSRHKQYKATAAVPGGSAVVKRGAQAKDADYCTFFSRNDEGKLVLLSAEASRDQKLPEVHGPERETYYLRMYNEFSMKRGQTDYSGKVPKILDVKINESRYEERWESSESESESSEDEQELPDPLDLDTESPELLETETGPPAETKTEPGPKNKRKRSRKTTSSSLKEVHAMQFHMVDSVDTTYVHTTENGVKYILTGYYLQAERKMTWGLQIQPVDEDPYFIAHMSVNKLVHYNVEGLEFSVPRSQALVEGLDTHWHWLYDIHGGHKSKSVSYGVLVSVSDATGWFRRESNHTAAETDVRAGKSDFQGTLYQAFTPEQWSALLRGDKFNMIYAANILLGKIKKAPESTGKKVVRTRTVKKVFKNQDGEEQEMEVQVPLEDAEYRAGVERAVEAAAKAKSDRIDQEKGGWQEVKTGRQGATREEREQAAAAAKKKKLENAKSKRAEKEAAAKLVPTYNENQIQIIEQIEDVKRQRNTALEKKTGLDTEIKAIDAKYKKLRTINLKRREEEKITISQEDLEDLRKMREERENLNIKIQGYDNQIRKLQDQLKNSRKSGLSSSFQFPLDSALPEPGIPLGSLMVPQEKVRALYVPHYEMKVWDKESMASINRKLLAYSSQTKATTANVPLTLHMTADYLNGPGAKKIAADNPSVKIDRDDSVFSLASTQGPVYLSRNGKFMLSPCVYDETDELCWALYRWYPSEGIYMLLARKHGKDRRTLMEPSSDGRKVGNWQFFGQFMTEKRVEPHAVNDHGTKNTKIKIEVNEHDVDMRLRVTASSLLQKEKNNPLGLMPRYPDVMLRLKEPLKDHEEAADNGEIPEPGVDNAALEQKKKKVKGLWTGCIVVPDCSAVRTPWYQLRMAMYNHMFELAVVRRELYDHFEGDELETGEEDVNPWDKLAEHDTLSEEEVFPKEDLAAAEKIVEGKRAEWEIKPGESLYHLLRGAFVYSPEDTAKLLARKNDQIFTLPLYLIVKLPVVTNAQNATAHENFVFYLDDPNQMLYSSVKLNLVLWCRPHMGVYCWELHQRYQATLVLLAVKMRYPSNLYYGYGKAKGNRMTWRWYNTKGIFREKALDKILGWKEKTQDLHDHYYSDIYVQNIQAGDEERRAENTYRFADKDGRHELQFDFLGTANEPILIAKCYPQFSKDDLERFFDPKGKQHPMLWRYEDTKKIEETYLLTDCPHTLTIQPVSAVSERKDAVCKFQEGKGQQLKWLGVKPYVRFPTEVRHEPDLSELDRQIYDEQDQNRKSELEKERQVRLYSETRIESILKEYVFYLEYNKEKSKWIMGLTCDDENYPLFTKDDEHDSFFTYHTLLSVNSSKKHVFILNDAALTKLISSGFRWEIVKNYFRFTPSERREEVTLMTASLAFNHGEKMHDVREKISSYFDFFQPMGKNRGGFSQWFSSRRETHDGPVDARVLERRFRRPRGGEQDDAAVSFALKKIHYVFFSLTSMGK